jgi:septal ring factor EnvC (AmiA/AmiB activator)
MVKKRSSFYCWLLLPVLFSVFSLGLWAQSSGEGGNVLIPENQQDSENTLNRLLEISSQLSTLNERLQHELQDSRQNSRGLQNMLEVSKRELEELRQELEVLHTDSTKLSIKAESSQTELTALLTVLKKAESSLMSLDLSFTAYKEATEMRIKSLDREKTFWKWGCVAAGVLAAGFGTAFLIAR